MPPAMHVHADKNREEDRPGRLALAGVVAGDAKGDDRGGDDRRDGGVRPEYQDA